MKYMTLLCAGQIQGMMEDRAGHRIACGEVVDSQTGIIMPVFDFGKVKVAMLYAYGPEPDPGAELEGIEKLMSVGDMAFIALMPEQDFNTSAYLSFADLDESMEHIGYDMCPPVLRVTVITDDNGCRYHAASLSFAMPSWGETRAAPVNTKAELSMWTWKAVAYFYGYMSPELIGTPTQKSLQLAHEAMVGWSCVYHAKHGRDYQLVPSTESFASMLKNLQETK